MTDVKDAKIKDLNALMTGVQNELYPRAVERRDAAIAHAYDFINNLAEEGIIDMKCEECGDGTGPLKGKGRRLGNCPDGEDCEDEDEDDDEEEPDDEK